MANSEFSRVSFFFVNLQCLHILLRIMFFLYGLPYLAWEMKSLLKAFRSNKKFLGESMMNIFTTLET